MLQRAKESKIRNYLTPLFTSLFICSTSISFAFGERPLRIGVVGAGIGGSAFSYFLKDLLKEDVEITVFEQSSIIGGRTQTRNMFGNVYEIGGSVIHPKNKYAYDLSTKLGLTKMPVSSESGMMSLIKGGEVVFETSSWTLVSLFKIIKRYGFDFYKLNSMTDTFISEFEKIYEYQMNGKSYSSPKEMMAAVNLLGLTDSSLHDYLTKAGYKQEFIEELVKAITLVNYGQTTNIHSLVGSVSVAGASSGLWSVVGGNKLLAESLLNNSISQVHLNTKITSSEKDAGSFTLKSGQRSFGPFDKIVYAHPMDEGKYQRTISTLVAGHLKPEFQTLGDIIILDSANFTCLSRSFPIKLFVAETLPIYKFFSKEPLPKEMLLTYFNDILQIEVADWLAYPKYSTVPPQLSSFKVEENVYSLNAIEWAASAIEMSLISAKNLANLIAGPKQGMGNVPRNEL